MYRIIYFSAALETTKEEELNNILLHARAYNLANEITGILLHIDGDFLQILEGEKENVKHLFEKIKKDKRHKGILTVIESEIKSRQFPDWSMGYKYTGYVEISKIKSLSNFNREAFLNADEKITNAFLKTFLESHKNQFNN
jgi:Sensors of blue-light using FAD